MLNLEGKQTLWAGYMETIMVFAYSLLNHFPLFFQYETVLVYGLTLNSTIITKPNQSHSCWVAKKSVVASQGIWQVYVVVFHGLIRVVPTLLIITLNLQMFFDIRDLMLTRKKLFTKAIPNPSDSSKIL